MSDDGEPSDSLRALERRIEAARSAKEPPARSRGGDKWAGAELAWRMMIELVAGTAIGFGMGWGLDALFGTRPLFLIIFILLGAAAGIRVMIGTAQAASRQNDAGAQPPAVSQEGASAPQDKGR